MRDADGVGGRAGEGERGAARGVGRRGGGRRDGHRGRCGVGVGNGHADGGRGGRVAGSVVGPGGQGVGAVAHRGGVPGEGEGRRGQDREDLTVLQVVDARHADVVGGGGGERHHAGHGPAGARGRQGDGGRGRVSGRGAPVVLVGSQIRGRSEVGDSGNDQASIDRGAAGAQREHPTRLVGEQGVGLEVARGFGVGLLEGAERVGEVAALRAVADPQDRGRAGRAGLPQDNVVLDTVAVQAAHGPRRGGAVMVDRDRVVLAPEGKAVIAKEDVVHDDIVAHGAAVRLHQLERPTIVHRVLNEVVAIDHVVVDLVADRVLRGRAAIDIGGDVEGARRIVEDLVVADDVVARDQLNARARIVDAVARPVRDLIGLDERPFAPVEQHEGRRIEVRDRVAGDDVIV